MPLYCLFNFKISENSSRFLQVTDVNLSLVQFLLKTSENSLWILPNNDINLSTCSYAIFENSLRIPPNNGCQSIAYSAPSSEMVLNMGTFLILIPDGIFKPIPDKFPSLLPMASLSPSPNGISKPIPASFALTSANLRAI